jgi:hypothetical protein
LVRHRRKPAELLGFGHFFGDTPVTHFYAQPFESVEMTHEGSKVRTCVRIRAHGKSFRASVRHLSAIKHLALESASPVRHRTRMAAHGDDADPHTLYGLRPLQRHALVRTLCAVETEELPANIHTAIAAFVAVLAEPEGRAP